MRLFTEKLNWNKENFHLVTVKALGDPNTIQKVIDLSSYFKIWPNAADLK